MVTLQIISKILQTSSNAIVEDNLLGVEYFVGYEKEFNFIQEHKEKYGNVPDKATFLATFPEFDLVEVNESDRYLVDTVREENLYYRSIPIIQKAAELLKSDSNAAAEFMMQQAPTLQPNYQLGGVDIVSQAKVRFDEYKDRKANQDKWYFESGFQELDEVIHGLQRGEELFVLFARTNQGKSWILAKMCAHVWKTGFNVGYISPEMTASSVGYRFDTLTSRFSNRGLMWGKDDSADAEYEQYINDLQSRTNRFMVATPADFGRRITVSKIRNWVKQYKLDMVAIDGITYVSDERGRNNDNKTTSLTNISEDLMSLSVELKIPILVVVQANRSGVSVGEDDGTPELESIRDSDGIAHNASKVISIRQKQNGVLEIGIKKQRNGAVGGKLNYTWDIDTGDFTFIPSFDDAQPRERTEKQVKETRKKFADKADVF